MKANERPAAGGAFEAWLPGTTVRRWPSWRQATRPPDVRAIYPDPTLNFTHATPYGLTLDELRAEWRRHKDWQKWELEARLLPTAVSR